MNDSSEQSVDGGSSAAQENARLGATALIVLTLGFIVVVAAVLAGVLLLA